MMSYPLDHCSLLTAAFLLLCACFYYTAQLHSPSPLTQCYASFGRFKWPHSMLHSQAAQWQPPLVGWSCWPYRCHPSATAMAAVTWHMQKGALLLLQLSPTCVLSKEVEHALGDAKLHESRANVTSFGRATGLIRRRRETSNHHRS